MSSNDLPDKCKKRFKGVENFLRRIAFNLGNTPSQTEVKIISCIPIDVTDLQQKILCLEKQLDAVKTTNQSNESLQKSPVVQTALCRGHCSRHSHKPTETYPTTQVERCEGCSMTHFPGDSASGYPHRQSNCQCWSSDPSYQEKIIPATLEISLENRKGLFKKQKKKKEKPKKKDKGKTQLVYYAQTSNSPFTKYLNKTQVVNKTPGGDSLALSRAYISEMIRKQYAPVPIVQDFSVASEISSPVCRDVENLAETMKVNSDVCSCCYGPFHDLDRHLPKRNLANYCTDLPTYTVNNGFYDTSLYDLIPVKEKSTKTTKPYYESPKRKLPNKINAPTIHIPETSRSRTKMHPRVIYGRAPTSVNYHTKRIPGKNYTRNERILKMSPQRDKNGIKSDPTLTSDSGCIDCGNVYVKRVIANNKPQVVKPSVPKTQNAECLTMILNDTECQTTTTQSVQIDQQLLEEKKTEETLNQIKTILQTVLTEVKTNTQLKKITEDKSTKDAIVQKGSSQGNMPGGSTLMNSYTYSPYNMSPYLPSCSRQMTSGCCYPNMPYNATKYMHNFPVFIQTPGRGMCCSSCYRNSPYVPKMSQMKQANTTATNTDKERSKETETLIKEIYKSMKMNIDFPGKEASASECNDLKSSPRISLNKSLYRPSVLDESIKMLMKANAMRNAQKSVTANSSLASKLMSNTVSMRSQIVSTTDTERLRTRRLENYLETMEAQKRQSKIEEERNYQDASPETTASDEVESSDAEDNDAYVPKEEPGKKTDPVVKAEPNKRGIFRKMLKSVKLFKTKSKKKEEQIQVDNDEEDEESEDNSEDYQTVYSQRVDHKPRYIPYPVRAVRSPHKIRAHSKISFSRRKRDRNQERSRKPYMEQEYRRQWYERFHEHQNRYSSEEPDARDYPRRPAYWQNYEARSALLERQNRFANVAPQIHTHRKIIRDESPEPAVSKVPKINPATKGLAWLKKHKLGIHCGPQWKKFILEG